MNQVSLESYKNDFERAWCPGCGNFGILNGIQQTLVNLNLPPDNVVICTGIGQAPKLPHYMNVNTFNGLHGREVATAQAIKLANNNLTVVVHAGDGGAYGEGGNHFIHAIRRNVDITVVVHDNHIYGLTKGQASPTTDEGTVTKVNPEGVSSRPMNPLALAVSQQASFVAQTLSSNSKHMIEVLSAAINHKGFSYVNILQPCVTWDHVHTYKFYNEHTEVLNENYDNENLMKALELTLKTDGKIPLGIIYKNSRKAHRSYSETELPLYNHQVSRTGIDSILNKFR
ncbi:MAG: 2-oxoacid ferredoxin oxidoreductase [Deltaproteobacteria bacterium]|nr:2-oxoacid ferredoxin oxidoreductase [Deltaproteobacteria bacterium]